MMKNCLYALLFIACSQSTTHAQISLENTYSEGPARVVNLSNGQHFAVWHKGQSSLNVHSDDHVLQQSIPVTLPQGMAVRSVLDVSEQILDTDTDLEFLLALRDSSDGSNKVLLYDQTSGGIQTFDGLGAGWLYGKNGTVKLGVTNLIVNFTVESHLDIFDPVSLQLENSYTSGTSFPYSLEDSTLIYISYNEDSILFHNDDHSVRNIIVTDPASTERIQSIQNLSQNVFDADQGIEFVVVSRDFNTGDFAVRILGEDGQVFLTFPDAYSSNLLELADGTVQISVQSFTGQSTTQSQLYDLSGTDISTPVEGDLQYVFLNTSGGKYVSYVNTQGNERVDVYNMDMTLWKSIPILIPSSNSLFTANSLSEQLFDADTLLEVMFVHQNFSTNFIEAMVINEEGTILQTIPNARFPDVVDVNNTPKLIATASTGSDLDSTFVFSLSGIKPPPVGLAPIESPEIEVAVFPNPTNALLNIKSTEALVQFKVTDISGRVMVDQKLSAATTAAIAVDDLPAGFYYVILYTQGGRKTIPFIRQ